MARRLKLLTTSLLLTCFALLAVAQVARPLQSVTIDPQSGLSLPHRAMTRHIALEAPATAADIQAPRELGLVDTDNGLVARQADASRPRYEFIPLGPFWTGRILRRIISSEPDGH
jgi:hypothetical protein